MSKRAKWKSAALASCVALLTFDSRVWGGDPTVGSSPRSPELQVLDRFVGDWATRTISRPTPTRPRETQVFGEAHGEWILGGHFVRFEAKATATDEEDVQIMTYDATHRVYRQWFYDSEGNFHQRTGTWDDDTRTLLWKGATDGVRFVIDDRFLDDGTLVYTISGTDPVGEQVLRIEGKVTRQR